MLKGKSVVTSAMALAKLLDEVPATVDKSDKLREIAYLIRENEEHIENAFAGEGVDDDITPQGFQAQLDLNGGLWSVDLGDEEPVAPMKLVPTEARDGLYAWQFIAEDEDVPGQRMIVTLEAQAVGDRWEWFVLTSVSPPNPEWRGFHAGSGPGVNPLQAFEDMYKNLKWLRSL